MDKHGPKMIRSAVAQVEEYSPPASPAPPTKVILVTWVHPLPSALGDGEWSVFWEGMDEGQGLDEGYGSRANGDGEESVTLEDSSEAMDINFFETIFQERAIVQTPTRIVPPLVSTSPATPTTSSQKLSAFFLLSHSTPAPTEVTIRFTPIWTSPIVPSPTLTVPVNPVSNNLNPGHLHKAWAKTRLVDLNELQQLADELARTGQRGVGIGSFKVGVDGGGHDEERLKWEAEMVGRERDWVLKTFLGKVVTGQPLKGDLTERNGDEGPTEQEEIEEGLEMLAKLAQGLKVTDDADDSTDIPPQVTDDSSSMKPSLQVHPASNDNDDEEDDLFAMPLSPRSPEIGVSPFSFRGPAISNLDAAVLSGVQKPNVPVKIATSLTAGAIHVAGGVPLTPTLGAPTPGEMRKKRLAGAAGVSA